MSDYTPNPAGPLLTPIPIPDDGTKRKAASVNVTHEALADNIAYLNRLRGFGFFDGSDDDPTNLAATRLQVPLMQPMYQSGFVALQNAGNQWQWDRATGIWHQHDVSSAGEIWFAVPAIPTRAKLTHVMALFSGQDGPANAAHSARPVTMPKITVYRVQANGLISLGTTTDPSPSNVAYDGDHEVVVPVAGGLVTGQPLLIKIEGESGTNSIADDFAVDYVHLRLLPT